MSGGYLDVLSLFEVPELARAPRFIGLGGLPPNPTLVQLIACFNGNSQILVNLIKCFEVTISHGGPSINGGRRCSRSPQPRFLRE